MDENYQTYVNRVVRMTLPEMYKSKLQHIQSSPKFQVVTGQRWQPASFPGYTVITPPWEEESQNVSFYETLKNYQQLLMEHLEPDFLIPVPPESFHLTVADLIWDSAYRHAVEQRDFEPALCDRIQQSFQQYESVHTSKSPIRWQLLGLLIMTRAVGVCLAPKDENSYEQIVQLRRAIYQNRDLIGLGIEQQYHFTAHVTLGYFGSVPPNIEQDLNMTDEISDRFGHVLAQVNQYGLDSAPQDLLIHRAELRKFDDMTRYYRQPDWPLLVF